MNEKELLSKETFIQLFNLSEIERIEKEDELFLLARNLGVEKQFKSSLKKYEKILNQKMILDNSLKLPKTKYDISNYNMGKYLCTVNGITDTKSDYKFSFFPILPVERYINRDNGKEKIKIIFYKEDKWHEKIVDKSQLSVNQKLLTLSDFGLDVTSENVKYYINYFNEILNLNDIKKLDSVSHIGWKDDDFIPYDSKGIFDGADDFRSIYNAISTKGSYETWQNTIKELRKQRVIKLLMATTLASPLLEKMNIQPFIVNLWSSRSGNGKTLSCMIAMSIWGNPSVGALRLSSNNTQNFYITVASFMRNFTCYFDELQIIKKSRSIDSESLIMDLCNGTEKGRLTKNSQAKEVKCWYNNFLFTSNDKLVKENAGEQIYNRVIDIEINERIIENGTKVAKIITDNYGFAGKEYMKYVQKIGFDKINKKYQKYFDEILEKSNGTTKQAGALAILLTANEIANECIFKDDSLLQVEDILDLVNNEEEIRTSIKAKTYIKDILFENSKKFETERNFGELWGYKKATNVGYELFYVSAQILYRELEKGGFEFNSVKKEWAEMNFLLKNSAGRYIHQTTMNSQKSNFIILDLHV